MTRSRAATLLSVALGLGALAGCGGHPGKAVEAGSTPTQSASRPAPTSTKAPVPSSPSPSAPTPVAPAVTAGPSKNAFAARCESAGAVRAGLERLGARTGSITDGHGSKLPVTVAGKGRTALVVLPGPAGDACAADGFIAAAAADKRFRVFAVDLCGSPAAACAGELVTDDGAQATLVLDRLRAQYHPARVVLVGVGRGGALAVHAAGLGLPADAVVNVSGAPAVEDLRQVSVPMLHLYDDLGAPAASRAQAAALTNQRVTVAAAPAPGWAALTGSDDALTGAGRKALDFAAS